MIADWIRPKKSDSGMACKWFDESIRHPKRVPVEPKRALDNGKA